MSISFQGWLVLHIPPGMCMLHHTLGKMPLHQPSKVPGRWGGGEGKQWRERGRGDDIAFHGNFVVGASLVIVFMLEGGVSSQGGPSIGALLCSFALTMGNLAVMC
eukprot:4452602-Amphidinium_carterae.1